MRHAGGPSVGAVSAFKGTLKSVQSSETLDSCAGWKATAKQYFGVFDQLILQQREDFKFEERSRRPPRDNMNALLSFLYTLLTYEAASALEAVGLDPYVGFLHADRPGRPSLALDLMEELRPVFADRLALSLVTAGKSRQVYEKGKRRDHDGRQAQEVLSAWQTQTRRISSPYLKERIPFGLIPHVQAMLLARYLRAMLMLIRRSFGIREQNQ
jgi:CRISPR-associated protein Cas1